MLKSGKGKEVQINKERKKEKLFAVDNCFLRD
jgi:hypothetical protein